MASLLLDTLVQRVCQVKIKTNVAGTKLPRPQAKQMSVPNLGNGLEKGRQFKELLVLSLEWPRK